MPAPTSAAPLRYQTVRTLAEADIAIRRLTQALLASSATARGVLATASVVGLGAERVTHGLGRVPAGYRLIYSDAPRPYPGFVGSTAQYIDLDFGGVTGSVTLEVW